MQKCLELVGWIDNKVTSNLGVIMILISAISCFVFDNYSVSIWCGIIFSFLMAHSYMEAKTMAFRIGVFDPETPKLLDAIINEAIAEYKIYNFAGTDMDRLHITDEMETQMNYGVSDIVVARLAQSSVHDKLVTYYGINLDNIIVMHVNMAVTNEVLTINSVKESAPPKYDLNGGKTTNAMSNADINKLFESMGMNRTIK